MPTPEKTMANVDADEPLFISVDIEVTDTNPLKGRLMQMGLVSSTGAELEVVFGVSNEEPVNDWVRENLSELLEDCWHRRSLSAHLPKVQVGNGWVDADFVGQIRAVRDWVMREQMGVDQDSGLFRLPPPGSALRPAVFVAYCGGLDWGFTAKAFAHAAVENPFHYEFVEISSLAMGKLGLPWGFSESDLEKALGIEPLNPDAKHNALEDARHQMREFQALMAL